MRALRSLSLAALLGMTACATPIELPSSFVELGDSGDGYRAMTSDDARIWVRTMYDATEGEVSFWAETLKRDLVEQRGYQFVREGEVENAAGEQGRWLEMTANHRGERVDYLIAIWSRERSWPWSGVALRVVEFAAAHEAFASRLAEVRTALATVRW